MKCVCNGRHLWFDCMQSARPADRFHIIRPLNPIGFECQHCCQKFLCGSEVHRELNLQKSESALIISQVESLEIPRSPYSWIDDIAENANRIYYRGEYLYAGVGHDHRS